MAAIKGADTKPELIIRRRLFAKGYRYRLRAKNLPGKPDLVFRKYKSVLLINGCFWHGHECSLFRWPKTREEFWRDKIGGNVARDARNRAQLLERDWRVGVVWECALKGKTRLDPDTVIDSISQWLSSDAKEICIRGKGGD